MLASKKIRHSKIPKSNLGNLDEYCNFTNENMKFEDEDDLLDPSKLEPNPTKCSFYKSLQNFALGKLLEKSNKSILEFIKSEQRLTDVFCDQDIEVKNCSLIGDSIAQVNYQRRADAVTVSKWNFVSARGSS